MNARSEYVFRLHRSRPLYSVEMNQYFGHATLLPDYALFRRMRDLIRRYV
jgi:hypothetical protein